MIEMSPPIHEENGLLNYKRALYEHIFIDTTYLCVYPITSEFTLTL